MHAVARLVLHGQIHNIQTSWVKMGEQGVAACLNSRQRFRWNVNE